MAQYMISPPRDPAERMEVALADLRYLLTFPKLGQWGMEALVDTLQVLLPDAGLSTIRE